MTSSSFPPVPARSARHGQRPVTANQVARLAGVSRTTVSFVLNDVRDKGISAVTWARVMAAAQQLGYQPNAAARSLASGSSGTVALVVPRAGHVHYDHFLAQLLASVNDACHRVGLKLLLESSEHEHGDADGFVALARTRRIDGLIIANPRRDQLAHLRALDDAGMPLVVLAPPVPGELDRFVTVNQDTRHFAAQAVGHLLGLGHRDIAFVGFADRAYYAGADREQGWRDALQAAGSVPRDDLLAFGEVTAQSGYQATRQLLAGTRRFTAVFAGNDTIAFGVLRALREAGLRVPEDVALVGYDDIPLAAFADPSLTTMRTDAVAHGVVCMQRLAGLLGVSDASGVAGTPLASLPDAQLVVRASCGAASGVAG